MKKKVDGRTTKGLRIREEVRESILTAYIALIRGGVPAPTARETAEHAGLSLRVIFKHFSDLRALRLESFNRIQTLSNKFFSEEIPDRGSAAERLGLFVQRHAKRLEYMTPVRRTAVMVESVDPDVAAALKEARDGAARDLEMVLGSSLKVYASGEKRSLLTALHMISSWESWEFLRAHYGMSPKRARAVMTDIALTVLAQAERRAHPPPAGPRSTGRSGPALITG